MKKKKLKKLKKKVDYLAGKLCGAIEVLNLTESHVIQCKNAITKLENDNKYYKEWMDRSGVDYKSWFDFEEKTCDTCKWKPLADQGGQDIPCMGCTADDKKMWKSKEA